MTDTAGMIDLNAPDPFSLAAWRANRLPTTDRAKTVWLLCSVLDLVYGRVPMEVLDSYITGDGTPKA